MGEVLYLNKTKRFTLDEARSLLPHVRKRTGQAVEEATPLIETLQDSGLSNDERERVSQELEEIINGWANDITHIGAVAKGLWLVDFDSGGGYYCWRFDEAELGFFHTYDDGFAGRTPIQ